MAVLVADDFWNHKRETAKKVRRRISTIMKWAVAQGFREDNPAGEALGAALPKTGKSVEHYAAVPHAEVAKAITVIRGSSAAISTKLALEFLILTATRSGEVRGMVWDEVRPGRQRVDGTGRSHQDRKAASGATVDEGGCRASGGRGNRRRLRLGVPERPRPPDER